MENVNGATLRGSHRAVFDVLRPVVRILCASGFTEELIRAAAGRACGMYAHTPPRGVWRDHADLAQLGDVLAAWTRDPDFIDEAGLPRRLSLDGGAGSFRALLRKAGCSLPLPRALAQLRAFGSVQPCDRGKRVRLLSSVVIPVTRRHFIAPPILDSIRCFAETVEYNLCEGPRPGEGRMHRWATCTALDPVQLDEANRFIRSHGQTFLEAMDEKLASCSKKPGVKRRAVTFGVGLYVFLDEPKKRQRARVKRQRR